MDYKEFFTDKTIKPKEKTERLGQWIKDHPEETEVLIAFARESKDIVKATVIEAFEFVTNKTPEIAASGLLNFVTESLADKAPRVKWEAARVIGNIAAYHPDNLDKAVSNLLINTEHSGTVVRWSAAFALGEILKINQDLNKELVPAVRTIIEREEKNSIKKIYLAALKKLEKK
jgi:hypothetical protein